MLDLLAALVASVLLIIVTTLEPKRTFVAKPPEGKRPLGRG